MNHLNDSFSSVINNHGILICENIEEPARRPPGGSPRPRWGICSAAAASAGTPCTARGTAGRAGDTPTRQTGARSGSWRTGTRNAHCPVRESMFLRKEI